MQLKGSGVNLSVAFPADVDTPGYKQENLTKVGDVYAPKAVDA